MDTSEVRSLSIIIAHCNESRMVVQKCVDQLLDTIDVTEWEVIIVDDASYKPLEPIYGTKIIRHTTNKGIGVAFDTGVECAKYENIFLMACDIRFIANQWASQMVQEIETNPKAITCTTCVRLGRSKLSEPYTTDIEEELKKKRYGLGATIELFSENRILDAKWMPVNGKPLNTDSYDIPCVLGAAYGVKKQWYKHIGGFEGHKKWGTLEPYISIKSWMFGGSCRVAPRVQVGHLFNLVNPHTVHRKYVLYNKFMVAQLLIPDAQRYIDHMMLDKSSAKTLRWLHENMKWIPGKQKEYAAKTELSFQEYCEKFNLSTKPQNNQQT
jgi:glycosyltransferase involved in cell wall biosynthesis